MTATGIPMSPPLPYRQALFDAQWRDVIPRLARRLRRLPRHILPAVIPTITQQVSYRLLGEEGTVNDGGGRIRRQVRSLPQHPQVERVRATPELQPQRRH